MRKVKFDGTASHNPGNMGIGVVLIKDGKIIAEISKRLPGVGTNNTAEYRALLLGVQAASKKSWDNVEFEGDSEVVINLVSGIKRTEKAHLLRIQKRVKQELSGINSYTFKWIPRKYNSDADRLASNALKFDNFKSNIVLKWRKRGIL